MKHIISQMRQTRATALNMASQYSMEKLNKIPQGFNNNMIWNLGHMVATVQGVCYGRSNVPMTVSTEYFDLYKPGSKPERDITQAEFEEIKTLMFSTLDQFEKDYDKKIFGGFTPFLTRTGVQLNSLEEAVKFLHFHDGIHFGVIMSQRKLV